VAKPRDRDKARRDRQRADLARRRRDKRRTYVPGVKGALPPTEDQLTYIAALSARLGRACASPDTRRGASSLIDQLRQQLAVAKPK
jgi:hypothetical protein